MFEMSQNKDKHDFIDKLTARAKRSDWKIILIVQMLVVQGIGWFACIKSWIDEQTYQISIPGIGTGALVLGFHLITSMAMMFIAWAITYMQIKSMRYFRIDHVYPDGIEARYGPGGEEREEDLDADDLEQEKWFGLDGEHQYIDIDRADIRLMFKQERDDDPGILDKEQMEKAFEKYTVERRVNQNRLKKPGDEPPGQPAYFYYVPWNRPAFYCGTSRKVDEIKSFNDCIVITHVPWEREFHFTRRTVPASGFNVKSPNTERIELSHVETLVGDLLVFVVTTSNYVRKEGARRIRGSDDVLARGLIDTVTYFYNRAIARVKPLEQLKDERDAEEDEYNQAVKGARMDVLARINMKRYQADRLKQIASSQKAKPAESSASVAGWVTAIVMVGVVVAFMFLNAAGVI